ncbi:hypothetical protein GCM10010319_23200 [Streptomyces blastmyceticus]|uniref:DDE Tnp4 domain-containing protein n=1 Tax=Streptomyces blastmyceticus TaxID=68180 RepID=A0ABN0WTE5_9ACTN
MLDGSRGVGAEGGVAVRGEAVNQTHTRLRMPVERAFARLKHWRLFRKARCSPNRLTSMVQVVLTLEQQR